MKINYSKFKTLLLLSPLLFPASGLAQLSGWQFKLKFDIRSSANRSNYAEMLIVDTKGLIQNGQMQSSGWDIRFSDSCNTSSNILDHYVWKNLNSDSTLIWVKIPALYVGKTKSIYMWYGNSGASGTSDITKVFSNIYKTNGNNAILGDTIRAYDWFEIEADDTIFVTPQATNPRGLVIIARNLINNGAIVGTGRGYKPITFNSVGGGVSGGGTATAAGSGGGGYGGDGGDGGYDAGDSYGLGGAANGTSSGLDIGMGSSGGSSPSKYGGSSGTVINLISDVIWNKGNIHNDGTDGQGNAGQNGGGGSGGGIMLRGRSVYIGGKMTAIGGAGGVGSSTANDDGGGGGGGRIKVFYGSFVSGAVSTSLTGGKGGPNGTAAPGEDGAAGTYNSGKKFLAFDSVAGSKFILTLTPATGVVCEGTPISVSATSGYSSYNFYVNGSKVKTQSSNIYNFGLLNNKDSISVEAAISGCYTLKAFAKIRVNPKPVVLINLADSAICKGDSLKLLATGAKTYQWVGGPKTAAWSLLPNAGNNYTVNAVDQFGCMDTALQWVTVNNFPVSVQISGNDKMCDGDSALLSASGANFYLWNGGQTSDDILVKPIDTTTYSVWGYDHPDCRRSASFTLNVMPKPDIFISGKAKICEGESTILGGNGGLFYKWSSGGTNYLETVKPMQTTTITLKGTDDNGCVNYASKIVTVDTVPEVQITGNKETCKGQPVNLQALYAVDYIWNTGEQSPSISPSPTASMDYYAIGTNSYDCSDTGFFHVTVNPLPTVAFTLPGAIDTLCHDGLSTALQGGTPTGAGGKYSGFKVASGSFDPKAAGTGKYKLTYTFTDAKQCADSAFASIVVMTCISGIADVEALSISVYPNPGSNYIRVLAPLTGPCALADLSGRIVMNFNLQAHEPRILDFTGLGTGSYTLLGTGADNGRLRARIIISQ